MLGVVGQTVTGDIRAAPGLTLAEYARAKALPEDFLKSLGIGDMIYMKATALRIPYIDQDGELAAIRFRIAMTGDKFRWRRGDKPCLYGLNRLAGNTGFVVIAEGESDCHTLWHHEFPAVGLPGAANWREDSDAWLLDGIERIYIIREPDKGGEAVEKWLSRSRIRDRAYLLDLGEYKDASGLHLADADAFKKNFNTALEAAVAWVDKSAEEAEEARQEAWERCQHLALSTDILSAFTSDLRHCGVVGEGRTVKIIFLALVSRFLDRPVSIAVKGPSSGGKSFVTESVVRFFPGDAVHALTAMSERNLVYSEEPLKHRFLILYEAAALENKFASYLIRSLLSEGHLRYETVEKTPKGIKARLIEREGPTGLIVTTTALSLRTENETRMLTVTITDTKEQTSAILKALADEEEKPVDFEPWHALQDWMKGGEHRVTIPFATALAQAVPPAAVRLRRDFKAVLNLIKAHAILHQANRDRDEEGRIIATLNDYAAVHDLVAELVAEGIEATVPATVRETVEAVKTLIEQGEREATQVQIESLLDLGKGAISRRVTAAIKRGYLKNREERKGYRSRLILGDPLPNNLSILPSPTVLARALHGCAATGGETDPPVPTCKDDDIERDAIREFDGQTKDDPTS